MSIEIRGDGNRVLATVDAGTLVGAHLSGLDLRNANMRSLDLTAADLSKSDLTGASMVDCVLDDADLREAKLSGHLRGASLKDALLDGALINWHSAEVVSELLRRAAQTEEQAAYAVAGLAARKCWDQLTAECHPLAPWAIDILAPWVKPEDDAPHFLKTRAKALALRAGRDWHTGPNLSRYPNLTYSPSQRGEGVRTHVKGVPVDEIHASAVASGVADALVAECEKHGVDIHELCDAIRYVSAQ
jgi:hypothetical protein